MITDILKNHEINVYKNKWKEIHYNVTSKIHSK